MPHETFDQEDMSPGPVNRQGKTDGFDPRNKHPDYQQAEEGWRTTRDVYLGPEGILPRVEHYVPQRQIGEAKESYEERKALLHVSGLLGTVIDAIVGLWARKPPEEDTWGTIGPEGEDGEVRPGSVAARILKDADRRNTTWDNHRRARATWMLVFRKVYTYIDTNKPPEAGEDASRADNFRPFVTLITPLDLVDWIEKDGKKVEAVIKESVDGRSSLDDGEGETEDRYLRLRLDGWTRYKVVKKGESSRVEEEGSGTYDYRDGEGESRLPLVETTLPLPRYITYNLARIVLAIINHDSHLDALNRAGALGQFLTIQGDEDEVRKAIKLGDKILPYPPATERPSFEGYRMEAAASLESRLESLVKHFWHSAMWEFSDRPTETTATEVEQEWAAGVGAFLALLAGAMEEAENEEKMLLAQAAEGPQVSDVGTTTFSREYRIEDVIGELTRLKELVYGIGDSIPLTSTLQSSIGAWFLKRLDETHGLLADMPEGTDVDAETEAAAAEAELERSRGRAFQQEVANQPGFPEEEEEEAPEEAA